MLWNILKPVRDLPWRMLPSAICYPTPKQKRCLLTRTTPRHQHSAVSLLVLLIAESLVHKRLVISQTALGAAREPTSPLRGGTCSPRQGQGEKESEYWQSGYYHHGKR